MNKRICISMACVIALNLALYGEDIGKITVESSTVTLGEKDKKTEVSTVNYIDSKQIAEIGAKQINELLKTIPGVTADVRPNEVVEIHMRGVNQNEYMSEDSGVAIIVDGVPVYAKAGKFRINMSDIKDIKVIKGSASYLYGNTATGGAVIITTSRPKGDKNQISLGAEAGSFGYRDYNAEILHSTENYAINLNVNDRKTDGYWTDSSFWSKSYGGKFSYYLDDSSDITFGVDKTTKFEENDKSSITGVTAASLTPKGTGSTSFQTNNDVVLDKYFVKYNKDFNNNSNLLVNAYNYFDEYDYDSSPQDTNNDGTTDTYSNHSLEHKKQKGVKLEYKQESDKLAYMLGYEYGDRKYETASKALLTYDSDANNVMNNKDAYVGETSKSEDNQKLHALYTELKYGFTPNLTGTFNIRHDCQTDEYVNASKVFSGTTWSDTLVNIDKKFDENSYRTGLVYNLSDTNSIFTNIATGFRTPTVDKIKSNIDLNITDEIKTQTSMTYEIGNRGKMSDLDYEVTLFQIDTKDIIGKRWGTYSSVTNQDTTNVGDVRNRGIELSLKSNPQDIFSYNLAYTYLKTEYTSHLPFKYNTTTAFNTPMDIVGKELPRTPNHTLDLYATYKATQNLKIISEVFARSSYYADEPNKLEMPGYAYMNLQARYNTRIGAQNFEFFAKVNNLFDTQYYRTVYLSSDRNVAGLSPIGVINAEDLTITVDQGREYFAGVKYTF